MIPERLVRTKFLLAFVGVAGFGLAFWPENDYVPKDIMRSVGHAFIIAFFLAITVDQIIRERFVKEIVRAVFPYLIRYALPQEIQEHIRSVVLSSIVRMNFEMRCQLIAEDGHQMRVIIELSYSVRNFSDEDKEYTPKLGLEDHLHPTFESLSVHHVDGGGYFYTATGEGEGARKLEVVERHGHKYINGDSVTLKASPIKEDKAPHKVTMKYALLVPDDFHYVESLTGPTINVTLYIQCPPGYEMRVASSKETPKPSGGYWEFKELFTHGQYVGIRWFPKTQFNNPTISSSVQT